MGLGEFFVFCIGVVALGTLAAWIVSLFSFAYKAVVLRIIGGLVILLIVWKLLQALGITPADPQIPSF